MRILYRDSELTINVLYILVLSLLPVLLIGAYMLFKKCHLESENEDSGFGFTQGLQVFIMLIGVCVYYLHRRWRLRLLAERAESLRQEAAFTESYELYEFRLQMYLEIVQKVVEEQRSVPLKTIRVHLEHLRSLNPLNMESFKLQIRKMLEKERMAAKPKPRASAK